MIFKKIVNHFLVLIVLINGIPRNALALIKEKPDKPGKNSIQTIFNVKEFGARGDGRSDDYTAILSAVAAVNKAKTGTLLFPKGTYFIAPFHKIDANTSDFVFKNCNNIKIIGQEAKIVLNGNFRRSTDRTNGKIKISESYTVTPILLLNCSNVQIEGLEIDGGVTNMTKDNGVVEKEGILIKILSCNNVALKDLYLHHSQTDGLYIGERSSNFQVENLRATNNARQGMSVIALKGATFQDCKFLNTGRTDGNYGSHSPRAGVDIEPRRASGVAVSDVLFKNCLFQNNVGAQFICSSPVTTSGVTLDNCTFNADQSTNQYQVRLVAKNVQMLNSKVDCKDGSIYPVWNDEPGTSVTIKGCTIRSNTSGIKSLSQTDSDNLVIENNTIIYTGNTVVKSYFPHLTTKNVTFKNNRIVIPQKYNRKGGASLVPRGKTAVGNSYLSTLSGVL